MKQLYFILIALAFSLSSSAQTEGASQLYGFKQKQTPGTVRMDDNGNERPRTQQYNYYIYLVSKSKVTPTEIWMSGQAYAVTASPQSSPVEYRHPNSAESRPHVLVPKTNSRVIQLSPSQDRIEKPNAKGKSLASKNELVVIYRANNKLYYKTVSKLTELEPVMMQ
ncbi:MAG: hypothetical protein ACXVLF_15055 [Flavisolibacter sp.]